MELQALLVLCGVGVAGVAVVLLMGLFSASGTSYEEAIAQQRKAATELLALAEGKNKPKKSNKKANKKLAKKEKNKEAVAATGSEVESEAHAESGVEEEAAPPPKPHVEFKPPVVVDVPVDSPINIKIRKRGKDSKVKPILVNKEDPSCVSDAAAGEAAVSNHFEEMHPKDEFELLHSAPVSAEKAEVAVESTADAKKAKAAKPAKGKANKQVPVKEEVTRERRNSVDAPKEQRKGKKEKANEEVLEAPREEVVPPLNAPQPSELTTEKLLKVHAPSASPPGKAKKKKQEPNVLSLMAGDAGGVNVGELVRVVREAALSRTEIQILTDALLNKHHDPLPEHSEWTEGPNDPMQKLKKQLADKEKALADEIEASQALHAKLKELRTSLNAERGRALAATRAAEAAAAAARAELHTHQVRVQRLIDDNHALAQDKHLLQSKLAAEGEAQAQRVQMEMHIQRLSESEATLIQQLTGLQAELQARVLELGQAHCEAAAARDAGLRSQQHCTDLAQQLQEANHAYSELEKQRQCAALGEQRAQQELRQAQDRLNAMADLQNEVQRLTSRAQTAESNLEKLKEEAEKDKQKLSAEVAALQELVRERDAELAELRLLKAPAQNGLPAGLAASLDHKAAELAKVQTVVDALRTELSGAQQSSLEQREQLASLTEQLVAYQHKNNELRTKNWKVMEALQSAEKALQTKSASAMPAQASPSEAAIKAVDAQYAEVVSALRAACPGAAPAPAPPRDWLLALARNLRDGREPADDLRAQNEHLQGLVDKYKKIIDDTEGVLSRLQANVTTEEARWAQLLDSKQRELNDLQQRTVQQMQKKIDSLESELQQARASNHSSLADAERDAERRLMDVGRTDKPSRNGPLQVGLEDK